MTGKTHKAVGLCTGIVFTYWGIKTYNNPLYALSVLASVTGAMLPDIDHNKTKIGAKRKVIVDNATKILSSLFSLVVVVLCVMMIAAGSYMQLVIVLLLIILPVALLSILAQIPFVRNALRFYTRHRGIMHTLAAPLLLYLGFMLISIEAVKICMLAMAVGYTSHLLLDCLTKMGCPILWPLYRRNITLLPIKTGTVWEYIVGYALAGGMLLATLLLL